LISLGFKKSPKHAELLKNTKSIKDVQIADYDGLFLAGGQSPMFTMIDDLELHKFIADFYEAGKVVAIVCHGTCTLLKTKLSNGKLLVDGKTWTGFANSEEQFADNFIGQKIQPFWIEEEAKKLPNTNFIVSGMFKPFAVRDGRLITGQQQYSGRLAARLVIEARCIGGIMKIAIIGAGNVGSSLAKGWALKGHEVVFGVRNTNSEKTKKALALHSSLRAISIKDAISESEVVLLAIHAGAVKEIA
jgi:putative intracellular protease/amidase